MSVSFERALDYRVDDKLDHKDLHGKYRREAARRMLTRYGGQGGSIVNISPIAATIGGRPGTSMHAASKDAVDVFTAGFARKVGAERICATVVRTGVIETDMIAGVHSGAERKAVETSNPMGRFGGSGRGWPDGGLAAVRPGVVCHRCASQL